MSESGKANPKRFIAWALVVVLAAVTLWQSGVLKSKPRIALITAGADPFWDIAVRGAEDSAKQFDVKLTVLRPTGGAEEQTAMVRNLVASGVGGIAVSPLDAAKQVQALGQAARATSLLTLDSDIGVPGRVCFVGTDNYTAGRACAELVKAALPEGGDVVISIGGLSKENGRRRRQGLIDGLLGRPFTPNGPTDAVDAQLAGDKYSVLATVTDDNNEEQAATNAKQAIADHPEMDCIVGLYGYSTPAILSALAETNKLGEIKVVAFDYHEDTLAGIDSGNVYGTIAQDPYSYGYHAVRILAQIANGQEGLGLPLSDAHSFPCIPVTAENLDWFRETSKK